MRVTMIWNDCHCHGISDHHYHTMDIDLHPEGQHETVRAIMLDYYKHEDDAAEMVDEAIEDYGLVGIFDGEPNTVF